MLYERLPGFNINQPQPTPTNPNQPQPTHQTTTQSSEPVHRGILAVFFGGTLYYPVIIRDSNLSQCKQDHVMNQSVWMVHVTTWPGPFDPQVWVSALPGMAWWRWVGYPVGSGWNVLEVVLKTWNLWGAHVTPFITIGSGPTWYQYGFTLRESNSEFIPENWWLKWASFRFFGLFSGGFREGAIVDFQAPPPRTHERLELEMFSCLLIRKSNLNYPSPLNHLSFPECICFLVAGAKERHENLTTGIFKQLFV